MYVHDSLIGVRSWPVRRELDARKEFLDIEVSLLHNTVSKSSLFEESIEACREYKKETGANIAIHAPYRGSLGSIRYLRPASEFARRIDADMLVIHPGDHDEKWELANPNGLTIGAEVVGDFCDPERIVKYVERNRLSGIVADFEHLVKDSPYSLSRSIKMLADRIIHVHLSGTDGTGTHMPLCKDTVDREELKKSLLYLRKAGYGGMTVFEVRENDYSRLGNARRSINYFANVMDEMKSERDGSLIRQRPHIGSKSARYFHPEYRYDAHFHRN